MNNLLCRLCAEAKTPDKLIDLQNDVKKHDEVVVKLSFLNAIYVNITTSDMLPKTVCLVCYDNLNKAHAFLEAAKRAQEVLSSIFAIPSQSKCDPEDDDQMTVFDDYLDNEDHDPVKIESNISETCDKTDLNVEVQVKQEPKHEPDDYSQEHDDTLNMHDIFSAAIRNSTFNSNVTIYPKELSDLSKKSIKKWSDYPWVCGFCNIEFLNIEMLRSHCKVVHMKCAALVCIDCKTERNESFANFLKHIRCHRKSLRHCCFYCNTKVPKSKEMSVHVKEHFQKSQISCPICGEIHKNQENLNTHLQDFNITKQKRRPRRKPGTPITIEDLTCGICNKVYKNPNSLRDHTKLHTLDRKRNYTCDRCGKMFFNKGTLTSHILSHEKTRPHECRICNKSFLYPNMLRRHVEMHSGIKPFSCEQCGRCFRLQYQLNAHKIIHTDAMPYTCSYCNKAFRFRQILKNHERQHTGAKPYSCQFCGMEFTNWSNYNKHMKRRHGMDTSKKKITPTGVYPVNPETGQVIMEDPAATEEWKTKIMVPGKRGKKKVIKQENV